MNRVSHLLLLAFLALVVGCLLVKAESAEQISKKIVNDVNAVESGDDGKKLEPEDGHEPLEHGLLAKRNAEQKVVDTGKGGKSGKQGGSGGKKGPPAGAKKTVQIRTRSPNAKKAPVAVTPPKNKNGKAPTCNKKGGQGPKCAPKPKRTSAGPSTLAASKKASKSPRTKQSKGSKASRRPINATTIASSTKSYTLGPLDYNNTGYPKKLQDLIKCEFTDDLRTRERRDNTIYVLSLFCGLGEKFPDTDEVKRLNFNLIWRYTQWVPPLCEQVQQCNLKSNETCATDFCDQLEKLELPVTCSQYTQWLCDEARAEAGLVKIYTKDSTTKSSRVLVLLFALILPIFMMLIITVQ